MTISFKIGGAGGGKGQDSWRHRSDNGYGPQTLGAYTMTEAIASRGNGPPPHIHNNEDETLYVLDGEFDILLGKIS